MVISSLQHLLKRHCGIKIRGLWNRSTIFQLLQLSTLSGQCKTGRRAMMFEDKRGGGQQRS
jgi:hypothetical protein